MSNFLVVVTADTNDADYVTQATYVDGSEIDIPTNECLEVLRKVANALYGVDSRYNWPDHEYLDGISVFEKYDGVLSEDDIGLLNDVFFPRGEYGIHTIKSIKFYEVLSHETIFEQ